MPGDAIDRQVVDDKQEPGRPGPAPVKEHHPHEWSVRQVKACLHPRGRLRQGAFLLGLRQHGPIHPPEGHLGVGAGLDSLPAGGGGRETQAERVVVSQEVLHGPSEQRGVQGVQHFQEQGLVIMVPLGQALLEEPALNGCQGDRAGDRTLLGLGGPQGARHLGQGGDRRVLEQLPGGQPQPPLPRFRR